MVCGFVGLCDLFGVVVVVFAGCALCVLRVGWFWRCSVDLLLELYGFGLAVHCLCY